MKGKIPRLVMVVVALAMAMSLVAGVGGIVAAENPPPDDQWSGVSMPNTQDWNLAPGTDVGPLAMSETGDGTLHAGVYDTWDQDPAAVPPGDPTLGTRWGSPRGTVRWAVFYSTDGGYDWKMGWELPEDDPGPIIDIVQAPGYEHPGWVYMITALHLYYSSDGGESFVRTTKCPGVLSTYTAGVWATDGYLTSLDVTKVPDACPACDEYMAVVGVSCGAQDGVFTYNDEGVGVWYDKQITNYPAGLSTGNPVSVPVYEVKFSPNYDEDGGIAAVAFYDPSAIGSAFNVVYGAWPPGIATTLVTWFDGVTKTWANQYLDAPFLIGGAPVVDTDYAVLDFAEDFKIGSSSLFAGIAGSMFDDVYSVKLLPPASGPSGVSRLNISGGADQPIDSLVVYGASGLLNAEMLVGIRDVTQPMPGANGWPAQIVRGTNLAVTPSVSWQRSIKNPEGRWMCPGVDPNGETRDCSPADRVYTGLVFVVARDIDAGDCGLGCTGDVHASTGYTGRPSGAAYGITPGPGADTSYVFSGVWRCAPSMAGMTWNGTGLLDDILASSTYLNNNYINYAEVVWEEVSPDYANDATQYFVSWSDWSFYWDSANCYCNGTLFWWRTMDNGETWDMLYRENTRLPVGWMTGMADATAAEYLNLLNGGNGALASWSVRATPQFTLKSGPVSASVGGTGTMYILGNNWPVKGAALGAAWWLWYSPDGGNAILPKSGMPQLNPSLHTYMHLGWGVFDNNTVALGDDQGLVYITTDGANSWTDGVATHYQQNAYVTNLKFSPTYSNDPGAGEDQTILVGTYYGDTIAGYGVAEVWISQDGAESDFTMLGTFPGEQLPCTLADLSFNFMSACRGITGQLIEVPFVMPVVVAFDGDWNGDDVTTVYAAASGLLDEMENIPGLECCDWKLLCHGDVGLYRADVVLGSPTVSVWDPMYDWDQLEALLPHDVALESRSGLMMPTFFRVILFTGLEVGNHDTVYTPYSVFDSWDSDNLPPLALFGGRITHGGVLRSPDGRAAEVEIDNVTLGLPRWTGLFLLDAVPGSTYLFTIGDRLDLSPGLRDMRLMGYHDTLCAAAEELEKGASPSDDERAGTVTGELEKVNVPVEWGAASSDAAVTYEWQLSEDPNFTTLVDSGQTTGTSAQFEQLEKDTQYYWRVRVIEPAHSAWTEAQGFKTVKSTLSSHVTAPSMENASPELGATNVPLQPTLGWGAMGGADYYNLQVATDANFSDVVIEEETEGTAYTPSSDLEKNTTYYWRVQGCTDDGECSEWSSTGHFTTGPEAQPGTPAWVWVVIVIGAILAIVVVVLIVRTRRPA